MAANKNNVTKRVDVSRPLTYVEGDTNFQELKNVIDDQQAFESQQNTRVGTLETSVSDIESGNTDLTVTSETGTENISDALNKRVEKGEVGAESVTTATGTQSVTDALDQRGPVFDNVADMKAAAGLTVGIKCRTLGYYTPGDGGGNDYEIVAAGTGTDDGGSFIDLAGSGLQAKGLFLDGVVKIKQFGAKADGTDTTTEVQSAFSYISQTFEDRFEPKTLPIYINVGEYRVTSAITAVSQSGVKIYGAGMQKSTIYNDTTDAGILDLGISPSSAMQFGTIDDLWLRGNPLSSYGMKVFGTEDGMDRSSRANASRNLYISDIGSGPTLVLHSWCWNFTSFNSWDSLEGVELSRGCNGVTFYTPYISGHVGSAITTTDYLNNDQSATAAAIKFVGGAIQRCGVSSGKRGQIDLRGGFNYSFEGVFYEGLEDTGDGSADAICYTQKEVSFRDCFLNPRNHEDGSVGPDGSFVIADNAKVTVDGFRSSGQVYDSLVRLEGSSPSAIIKHAVNGGNAWNTGIVNDQSSDGSWSVEGSSGYSGLHLFKEGVKLAEDSVLQIGNMGVNTSDPDGSGIEMHSSNSIIVHQTEGSQSGGSSWFRHYLGDTQSMVILNSGGLQNANGVYGTLSDARLKKVTGKPRSYLADLLKLDLVKYMLLSDVDQQGDDAQEMLGLIAQDVQQVMPGLVGESEDGFLYIKTSILTLMLLQAVQEMNQ